MTFTAGIVSLQETATVERVGDRTAARLESVRALVTRELGEVEAIVAARTGGGVSPANESAHHLFDAGGKRVRPMACLLACACFPRGGWSPEAGTRARDVAAAAELVHMATLLHDDVVDDADERRARPTARKVWGNAVSVLAGDSLLVEALRLVHDADAETFGELLATLRRLVDGEVLQLRGRRELSLDEARYHAIVEGKTASLFEWALRSGGRAGGAPRDAVDALGAFGAHIGVAFQLVDDVIDYDGVDTGKTMLADLAEGKVTLPLIRAAEIDPSIVALVARVRAGEAAATEPLAARVRASGACEEVRRRARNETAHAAACLARIPKSPARDVLDEVAANLTARVS